MIPQIAKSRFQCLKMPFFVENVTFLPGTDIPQIAKSRFQWLKMKVFVENVTVLPGTDDKQIQMIGQ
jgi:hypothetical protein